MKQLSQYFWIGLWGTLFGIIVALVMYGFVLLMYGVGSVALGRGRLMIALWVIAFRARA